MSEYLCVYVIAPSFDVAHKIGRALVEERLAACVNIIPGMHSIYRWQCKIETATEVVLIAKSRASLFEEIEKRIMESWNCTLTTAHASWRGQSRPATSRISIGSGRKRLRRRVVRTSHAKDAC
jgi:periplasmic divalent cation tolerance protein